jgi:hypothetical protein
VIVPPNLIGSSLTLDPLLSTDVKEVGLGAQTLHGPTFSLKTINGIEGQRGQDTGTERDRALTILSQIGVTS